MKRKPTTTYHNGFKGVWFLTWDPKKPLIASSIAIAIEHGWQRARKYGATTTVYLASNCVYTLAPNDPTRGGTHIATVHAT